MRLTLTLISLLTVITTTAQIRPGLKLGMNFSTYKLGKESDAQPIRIGINTGLVAQIPISKKFYVQPELLYTQKGHRYPSQSAFSGGKENFDYLALAAVVGYKIIPQLHVGIGPEVGYLLKQKIELDNGNIFGDDPNFDDWDVSLDFNLAFYPAPNFAFELRAQRGIKKIYDAILTDQYGNQVGVITLGRNHLFQVNAVYFLARRSK